MYIYIYLYIHINDVFLSAHYFLLHSRSVLVLPQSLT